MKRFKFSLESVHNLRASRREEAERKLGLASSVIRAETAAIEDLGRARAVIEAKLATATGLLNAAEVSMQVDYLALLAEREVWARQHLAMLERERDELCQIVQAAAREAEVTGKLRAGQHAMHTAEIARAEQNWLDEIAVASTLRRERSGDA
ncbi:MAG: flagellar export protein FliJ [Blastocatellia bacterium]